jgi:hypothetical protein
LAEETTVAERLLYESVEQGGERERDQRFERDCQRGHWDTCEWWEEIAGEVDQIEIQIV